MSCAHEVTEPVEVSTFGVAALSTDHEIVARVCTACLEALPANWGCTDCEWIELLVWGSATPRVVRGRLCTAHTYSEELTAP